MAYTNTTPNIFFEVYNSDKAYLNTIVFLHGFSGSSKDWERIIEMLPMNCQIVTIDLIGHGKSESPNNVACYSDDGIALQILSVINILHLKKIILAGYSMGGRAALVFSLAYPELIKGLLLESASPGIIDAEERLIRQQSDSKLADLIKHKGIEYFVDYWMNLPLFSTQKKLSKEILNAIRINKLNNSITGLVNSLHGFGQGTMPELWSRLPEIKCKTLLLSGELDQKYTQINSRMAETIQLAQHKIIAETGHNIHSEKPGVFVSLVEDFILNLI